MKERTLKEIEEKIDAAALTGDVGRVMDLIDEHGNTMDKMFHAISSGDIERVQELEELGIDLTQNSFLMAAVDHGQLPILRYQVQKVPTFERS